MYAHRSIVACLAIALVSHAATDRAAAQTAPLSSQPWPVSVDSGWVSNTGDKPAIVFTATLNADGAPWVRMIFDEVTLSGDPVLGTDSHLLITSHDDGAIQVLNSVSVVQWGKTSAYFNGDRVTIDLVASPNTGPSRLVMSKITAGLHDAGSAGDSICGPTDDRILSSDPRSGRIMPTGCSGWLFNDCQHCFGTAGHCISNGQTGRVMQFNVPLSSPSGMLRNPGPEDQYAIDPASIQSNGGRGLGNDWAYYGCFVNSTTGLTAFEAQGDAYAIAAPPPVQGQDIRITGYGSTVGTGAPLEWNQVQKTHSGPYFNFSGTRLQYFVDTTGGNSGSPVILETTGEVIGVHTHAGCDLITTGNTGTGLNHAEWQDALAAPIGVCTCPGLNFLYPGGRPATLDPNGGTTIEVIVDPDPPNVPEPNTGLLHYDDGGGFVTIPMQQNVTNQYVATFPALTCGGEVRYYFSAQATNGTRYTDPQQAPTQTFAAQAIVGVATLVDDNFELDNGWTVASQNLVTGEWVRVVPRTPARIQEPPSDYDGSGKCWLTGNDFLEDVDGGPTILTSPAFDLAGLVRPTVSYARWIASTGVARIFVDISNDNGATWTNVENLTGSPRWVVHTFEVENFIALTDQIRLRFSVADQPDQWITEAAVDAFKITSLLCSPPFRPGDLNCDGAVNGADIDPFFLALGDPAGYETQFPACNILLGDMNGDGAVNGGDIDPFFVCLGGGSCP